MYAGARDETEAQIAKVLHFLPQEQQHAAFNLLDQRTNPEAARRTINGWVADEDGGHGSCPMPIP